MMYWACHICGTEGEPPVCARCEHIASRYQALERAQQKSESVEYWVREKVQSLFRAIAPQYDSGADEIVVPRRLLADLLHVISATEQERREFVTDNLLANFILLDAADMVRASGTNLEPKVAASLLKRLREYYEHQGWSTDTLRPGARICRNIWD